MKPDPMGPRTQIINRVQGLGFRVQGLGFGGLGFRVPEGLRIQIIGF